MAAKSIDDVNAFRKASVSITGGSIPNLRDRTAVVVLEVWRIYKSAPKRVDFEQLCVSLSLSPISVTQREVFMSAMLKLESVFVYVWALPLFWKATILLLPILIYVRLQHR